MMKNFIVDMVLEGGIENRMYLSLEEDEPIIPEEFFDSFNIKRWYIYEAS